MAQWQRFFLLALAAAWFSWRIWQQQKRNQAIQNTINYFAHSGYEHSSVNDILWDICRNCISRLGLEDCVIYLLDEEKGVLVQKAAFGPKSPSDFEIFNPIEIPLGKGIV